MWSFDCRSNCCVFVGICENIDDISNVFNANINRRNFIGEINNEYVIQEYLEGKQYFANSVSVKGHHFITDIWENLIHNEGTYLIDEYAISLSRESDIFKIIENYTYKALNALEITNGAAHSEIKMTPEGPKLIETGARLVGLVDFATIEECNGFSQLSVLVDSILEPDLFIKRTRMYKKKSNKYMRLINMFCAIEGQITKTLDLNPFLKITSLKSISTHPSLQVGGELKHTKYSVGNPGYAMLINESLDQLESDYLLFRELEQGFYQSLL